MPGCENPGTDMHECFVPKSAVMCMENKARAKINMMNNCVLICNYHNLHISHTQQQALRRKKVRQAGLRALLGAADMSKPEDIMNAGVYVIQAWVDSLELKGKVNIREMAGL